MAEFEIELTAEQKATLEATGDNYFTGQMRFATAIDTASATTTTLKMSVDGAAVFNTLVDSTYMKTASEMLLVDPVHMKHALVRQIIALESDPTKCVKLLVDFGMFEELALHIAEIHNFDYETLPRFVWENNEFVDAAGNTPLFWAISRVSERDDSYFDFIKEKITQSTTDFTHVNADKNTLLIHAINCKLPKIACAIIEEMEQRDYQFDYVSRGGTALIIACENGLKTVVNKLIETGTSYPDYISFDGYTALLLCAKNAMWDQARKLLHTCKSLPETVGPDGKTAFMRVLIWICCRETNEEEDEEEDESALDRNFRAWVKKTVPTKTVAKKVTVKK